MKNGFNADELFEPIEVVLDGRKYKVDSVTQQMMEDVSKVTEQPEGDNTTTALDRQLAIILGVKAEDFVNTDVRKKSATVRWLTQTIGGQLSGRSEEGNVQPVGSTGTAE